MKGITQDHIEHSVVEAFNYRSNLTENYFDGALGSSIPPSPAHLDGSLGAEVLEILGFTSPKVKHLLNNLCNFDGCSYLELGVWAGATFCSAIYNNDIHAVAIDKFGNGATTMCPISINAQVWENLKGTVPIRDQCISNIKKYRKDNSKIQMFQSDIFEFDFNFIKEPINVFMLDCDQSEDEVSRDAYFHSHIIDHCKDVFADKFIFIKDDWNWTRHATRLGLEKLTDYKIVNEVELFTQTIEDFNDFWNGIYIALLEKK